jgi:hypothetical protein
MRSAQLIRPVALSEPPRWWQHLIWVAGAGTLSMAIAAVFAGLLHWPRNLYLVPYIGLSALLLTGYAAWSGVRVGEALVHNWGWGLLGATLCGVFSVQNVLSQPGTPPPQGPALAFAVVWLGLAYGTIDSLLLAVLPVYATWQALRLRGWTSRWLGRFAAGLSALLAGMLVVGLYHLGYTEFRNPTVLFIMLGVGAQSLAYLLTGSPLAAIGSHVAMHLAAVVWGIDSVMQLPPHS